jgi:AcrR family transcriptional regulator
MHDTQPPKERIRREAMRLFVDHGVDAVSMRDIADAVGLKAPSLYAHFRSREELIGDLFFASYAEYGRRLAAAAATPGGFHRQLEAMVRVVCALHAEDELLFNFLLLTQHGFLRQIARSRSSVGPSRRRCTPEKSLRATPPSWRAPSSASSSSPRHSSSTAA